MMPRPAIEHPDVLLGRAISAERDGGRDAAIQLYRRVLEIDPVNLQAINRLGALAGENGELSAAVRQFRHSLRIDPNQSEVWFNLGIAQSRLGQSQEALASFDSVIGLTPLSVMGHLQRGATLARLGRYQDALAAFDEARRLAPNDLLIAIHRGLALQWCGRHDQAFAEFDRAIAIKPDFAEAWVSKALLLMTLEDLPAGLPLFEWRWRMSTRRASPSRAARVAARPVWLGEPGIGGKTLLIYLEQGLGDVIQFCRYAPLAAKAGARVIVEVQPALTALMATLPGVSQVVSEQDNLPDHDFCCPMMSLPLAFRTTVNTIPADVPYLHADAGLASEWSARLSGLHGRRIGLAWGAGSRLGDSELVALEHRKTVPLNALAPLATVAGCEFVSLQLGPAAAQAASPPAGMIVHDLTAEIHDFADTAALMENLDLVISVCTSTAHLAGALGKPVWLLNRFDTDWRWFLNRGDSPWYPTMRIFRQPQPGDWASVLRSVTEALCLFVGTGQDKTGPVRP
jgi:tetratricopeptide (TPR) repeat protein